MEQLGSNWVGVDCFATEGPQAGFRLQNGWQNSGLPWSAKMNPEKIYRSDNR